ncbi:MAG: cupin domain-containing protein [Pseudomonadota bacterium]
MTAEEIIATLGLAEHPEGGWYRETWSEGSEPRSAGTCIYFLLRIGEFSHWHRVDAAEIWHFYAGAALELSLSETDVGPAIVHRLGPEIATGARPQVIVPPGHWQSARSTGEWSLVGCTVSPGFQFEGFELAPPTFTIPKGG